MRSSEVAKLAGVSVRTLRHYHKLGILPEPERMSNGYRDYAAADVAHVLRIKRLASLGFPLARIGDLLMEMDAAGSSSTNTALDELDAELALEIDRLKQQRATIAELRRENLDLDMPARFARAVRAFVAMGAMSENAADSRTTLVIASQLYDEKELDELERVVEVVKAEGLSEVLASLEARLQALAPNASEEERDELVGDALVALSPVLVCFDAENWLRPARDEDYFLADAASEGLNAAQRDVYERIEAAIEDAMRNRLADQDDYRR